MTDTKCEPPEELANRDGWHWVRRQNCEPEARQWRHAWRSWQIDDGDTLFWGAQYLGVAPSPDTVRALVEALEGWTGALDAKREFERQNPGNSTKAWDNLFYAVEAAETTALAALARAKAEGLA